MCQMCVSCVLKIIENCNYIMTNCNALSTKPIVSIILIFFFNIIVKMIRPLTQVLFLSTKGHEEIRSKSLSSQDQGISKQSLTIL